MLKCRWVKGQRFYLIKWQEKGAQSSWLPAKDISALIDDYHNNWTIDGKRKKEKL